METGLRRGRGQEWYAIMVLEDRGQGMSEASAPSSHPLARILFPHKHPPSYMQSLTWRGHHGREENSVPGSTRLEFKSPQRKCIHDLREVGLPFPLPSASTLIAPKAHLRTSDPPTQPFLRDSPLPESLLTSGPLTR